MQLVSCPQVPSDVIIDASMPPMIRDSGVPEPKLRLSHRRGPFRRLFMGGVIFVATVLIWLRAELIQRSLLRLLLLAHRLSALTDSHSLTATVHRQDVE